MNALTHLPDKVIDELAEIENKAQDILTDREEIVALDKLRNQNREGLRALKNSGQHKAWVAVGPLLVKMSSKVACDVLQKEQVMLDSKVNTIRSDLRVKVNDLRDLEHQAPVPGLMLNPISRTEMEAIGQIPILSSNTRN